MNITTITCIHCHKTFGLNDAISHQIEDELTKAKIEQSEILRKELNEKSENEKNLAVENALAIQRQKAKQHYDKEIQAVKLEVEKVKQSEELKAQREKQALELENEKLRLTSENSKENEKNLHNQLKTSLDDLAKANKAKDEAELSARKELIEKEKIIREEATVKASENYNTKIREQEETINKLREQLTISKQIAEQGSQQLQGEILELDIEKILKNNFPYDDINEVKKGERGSDIRQTVNEQFYRECGLILWEAKNAKTFQQSWIAKLKDEMANEKAQVGVIVFSSPNNDDIGFEQLEDNIWLVKPRHVLMLASVLREVVLKVFIANRNAEGKDTKIEMMYNYLTGGEFNNRIRYIIESYNEMTSQLSLEKKQTQKRWATQEKIIEKVTSSLYGMSGDLQGIAGQEIIALPELSDNEPQLTIPKTKSDL